MGQNNLNLRSGDPTYTIDQIQLSGDTYQLRDNSAIHNLNGYWTSGQTQDAITAATGALAESIAEQHYQTSGDVQNAISGKADTTAVTEAISEAVSGKADTTAVTQSIEAAVSGKIDTVSAVTSVGVNTTSPNKEIKLNFKRGGSDTSLDGGTIVKFGTGLTFDYSARKVEIDSSVIAQKSDIPSVTSYADAVKYDTATKNMKFYHGGTGGTEVFSFDASPFLIDGMVQNVEIKDVAGSGTCLVISFNTDAGKQDINIPISTIFDASNYYTKYEVDAELSAKTDNNVFTAYTASTATEIGNKADTTAMTQAISEATSGKADTTAVTQSINEAVSGKVDTSTYTAYTADTATALAGKASQSDLEAVSGAVETKQDELISGTNIKTVGGESLLGSGNISFPAGLQVSVQDTTLVFG